MFYFCSSSTFVVLYFCSSFTFVVFYFCSTGGWYRTIVERAGRESLGAPQSPNPINPLSPIIPYPPFSIPFPIYIPSIYSILLSSIFISSNYLIYIVIINSTLHIVSNQL